MIAGVGVTEGRAAAEALLGFVFDDIPANFAVIGASESYDSVTITTGAVDTETQSLKGQQKCHESDERNIQ